MRFVELNLFGIYVAPISAMALAAWLILLAVQRLAWRFGLLQQVWHPALFGFAVYVIALSAIILVVAR